MFSLRSLTTAAAFAALAGAPAAALAVQTAAPVSVTSCNVQTSAPALSTAFAPVFTAEYGNVNLSFVNNANVTATNVELLLNVNGDVQHIDTAGSFAPGTRIDRTAATLPYVYGNDVTCQVARVDFSNGTSWNALAAAPKTTAQR